MKATIDGLRCWAIVDGDADNQALELSLEAAKAWFAEGGVPEPGDQAKTSALYVMGVYRLATHYYDCRAGAMGGSNRGADPTLWYGVNAIRLQLQQLTEPEVKQDGAGGP